MIVKGTKQLGSFKRGINIYVPKRISALPAPSGIPTAGPLMGVNVNVGGNLILLQLRALENDEGIYYTVTDGYWRIGPGEDNPPVERLFFGGVWQFISSNNFEPPYDQITNSTPNQSINYIPTAGWSPSITITAA